MLRIFGLSALVVGLCASLACADPVTEPIKLFNGKDLTGFYTYLQGVGKNKDEKGVFSVQDGAIRVSGGAGIDSESVTELLEEGQTFEAEAVSGVENAADPDVSEVVTHQFPEDDVPGEYQDPDKD